MTRDESLRLENQLCFPLYACSRKVIKQYHGPLRELGLTYPQYITMMVLWEEKQITAGALGKKLCLDSGTLTPLLKNLEAKGYITRQRSDDDERVLVIGITPDGEALKEQAYSVPEKMCGCIGLAENEASELYRLLYKLLGGDDAV